MKPTIRRINARYRGPMESQKHETFYRSLDDALTALKQTYQALEESVQPIKAKALSRQHLEDLSIYRLNPSFLADGIGVTYPYQGDAPGIERVGVIEKTLKQNGGFEFSPKPGVTHRAQRILILDEISCGNDEHVLPATRIPLDVAINIPSQEADMRKEFLS